jgi:hypothetical protein
MRVSSLTQLIRQTPNLETGNYPYEIAPSRRHRGSHDKPTRGLKPS